MTADIEEGAVVAEAVLEAVEVVIDAIETVSNLRTRAKATFSPRVDGDPGWNFTLVTVARCPMVGANWRGILMTVAIGMA
jgi:hypothetical protein